ncbi:MAG: type II/IV secretion system protein [Patescibacteria group bacterium]|nr:type II/IV secretion system protein [Patescibacteria group bacterium]MDE2173028.1 type II/IV secretion system protein [Patescibacteria group bacterium]
MNLLGLLLDKGVISPSDRVAIEADIAKNRPLEDALTEHGVSLRDALEVAGKEYGLPTRILGDPPASEDVFGYIPIDSARHYGFVPLTMVDGALEVGITDPDNIEALDALQFISGQTGIPYKIFLITKQDFDRVLNAYQNLSGEIGKALSEYETTAKPEPSAPHSPSVAESALDDKPLTLSGPHEALKEDAPVTKIVSTILRYAIEGRASDIHIEPSPGKTRVRFREDGDLHTSLELPAKMHEAVVARVKILAKLRLDEKRKPQDGRFSANVDTRRIDFRVSTFPTEFGEKVVMRILDQSAATATLESVGLSEEQLAKVRAMMKVPYGIILIAGPTGSGKSTTLFAMLSELDRETANVVSLEDPVEYEVPGVSQSQVRPEIGYTFASGLRSILRQDPDVIMVGEIRDKETAALAVQAALTGHLVFSTIHTNTAAGAIPRLIDMGVDPFLIAPTLIAVIGQRLVQKLCEGGGKPFPITGSIKLFLDRQFADLPEEYRQKLPPFKEFYHAAPTAECPNGTHGRMGVFEILRMDKKIEQVVLKEPIEERIYGAARLSGMLTMREDAIVKALGGEVSFEEINTLGGELFPEGDND